MVIPHSRVDCPRVTHPFATLPAGPKPDFRVRLACLIHAANVRSEPGSNSPWYENFGHLSEERYRKHGKYKGIGPSDPQAYAHGPNWNPPNPSQDGVRLSIIKDRALSFSLGAGTESITGLGGSQAFWRAGGTFSAGSRPAVGGGPSGASTRSAPLTWPALQGAPGEARSAFSPKNCRGNRTNSARKRAVRGDVTTGWRPGAAIPAASPPYPASPISTRRNRRLPTRIW